MKYIRIWALLCALAIALAPANALAEGYHVDVDIANQIVTVYTSPRHGEENIVRQMICSTGYGTSTPRGTFIMPEPKYENERQEWYWFGKYKIYAKYASRIKDSILFHSILFPTTTSAPTWASSHALGSKASHGCVRLRVADAKWIAENCPPGTVVHIFDDGEVDEALRALLLVASFDGEKQSYADFCAGRLPLSRGCKLPQVNALQEALNALGYDCGEADGIFGPATERAVLAWQQDEGMDVDGVMPPEQLDALLAEAASAPKPADASEPSVKSEDAPAPESTDAPENASTPKPAITPEAAGIPENAPSPKPTDAPENASASEPAEAPEAIASPTPTPDVSRMEGTIALVRVQPGSCLNLREKADAKSPALARLGDGDVLRILREGPVWSRVQYGDQTGWVGSDYIEIVKREMEEKE